MARRQRPYPTDGEVALRKELELIKNRLKVLRKRGEMGTHSYQVLCQRRAHIINQLNEER